MDAQLLNSRNRMDITSFSGGKHVVNVDVVVIGAGVSGLTYAMWLKKMTPSANILVLERSPEPYYKIGESLLSPSSRMLYSLGFDHGYLHRLFAVKSGLKFYYTSNADSVRNTKDIDITGLDIAYQVERRVLELSMVMKAQREGINVYHDVDIDFSNEENYIGNAEKIITCTINNNSLEKKDITIIAKIICDASGMARKVAGLAGVKQRFESQNCTAYWAYFKSKPHINSYYPEWNHPTTKHICFPEGWMWGIRLLSFQKTPLANLVNYIDHLLDNNKSLKADDELSVNQLAEKYDCTVENIYSVGFTVRDDMFDSSQYKTMEEKFYHWINKYPEIKDLMENYTLINDHYHQTFFARKQLAYYSEKAAGNNWVAIGDAAAFVNPLVSPGINYSVGHAYKAAQCTSNILTNSSSKKIDFIEYEQYIYKLKDILYAENKMYYLGFLNAAFFEKIFLIKFAMGIGDTSQYQEEYLPRDIDPFFVMDPMYTNYVTEVIKIMLSYEDCINKSNVDEFIISHIVESFHELTNNIIKLCLKRYSKTTLYSRYMTRYDDFLQRNNNKSRGKGIAEFIFCSHCLEWRQDSLNKCPRCGGLNQSKSTTQAWDGFRPFIIDKVIQENKTVSSFYLIPEDGKKLPIYHAGQFITCKIILGSSTIITRSYTLSDSYDSNYYKVTIKQLLPCSRYPHRTLGIASNYFHDYAKPSTKVWVSMPSGNFILPTNDSPIVLLSAGIGITPMLSMINTIIKSNSKRSVWFIHGNHNSHEMINGDYLRHLADQQNNFNIHICFSRPTSMDKQGIHFDSTGHISIEFLQKLLPNNNFDFFLCGPMSFMESLFKGLLAWEVPESRIHYEFFGQASIFKTKLNSNNARVANIDSTDEFDVTFAQSGLTIKWNPTYKNLLDFSESHGIQPDFNCREGVCETCKCKLLRGEVKCVNESTGMIEDSAILLCCSQPTSDIIIDA